MARFKVWTLVLFFLALIYLALIGSPTIGIAAPKPPAPAQANAIRVTYSLAADQTSTIELPPNLPVHVMITKTSPGTAFTWIDLVSFSACCGLGIFANGFDMMGPTVITNPPTAPYRVIGSTSTADPTHLLTIDGDCGELIVVSPTAIGVHNKATNSSFQVCPQLGGTVTVIY